MAPSARDRISVDLHGLKAALVARAAAEQGDASAVVRRAIERELGLPAAATAPTCESRSPRVAGATVRLSIRLTSAEAEQLAAGAQRAGLSRGAFVAGLLSGVPSLSGAAGSRLDAIAALTASSAELATLTRNIHHLSALLHRGEVRAAQEYRRMLDTLGDDVRAHLRLAGSVLADLRPARASNNGPRPPARP